MVAEDLAEDAREGAPVLHHVGNTRGIAEIVVRNRHASIGQPRKGKACEMQKGAAWRGKTDRRTLEIRTAQHRLGGHDVLPQDFFRPVHIAKKKLESPEPLLEARLEQRPFRRLKNFRKNVAEPRALKPRLAPARDIEVDPHLAHGCLETFHDHTQITTGRGEDAVKERTVSPARCTIRIEYLVPERTFARLYHHRRDRSRRAWQGQGDTLSFTGPHARRAACCAGGTNYSTFSGSSAACSSIAVRVPILA